MRAQWHSCNPKSITDCNWCSISQSSESVYKCWHLAIQIWILVHKYSQTRL